MLRLRRPRGRAPRSTSRRRRRARRAPEWRFDPPTEATRDAVWRYAGPIRNPTDLAALIPNPYPLAKAIATAALERRESRGGHLRSDCPDTDPALDGVHVVLAADGAARREDVGLSAMLLGVDVGGTFTDAVLLDDGTDPHRQGADHAGGRVRRGDGGDRRGARARRAPGPRTSSPSPTG